MSEYESRRAQRDPGHKKKAGIVAWFIVVISFLNLYFAILNPVEEHFNIYIILGLSLVFGLSGLAAFEVDIDLRFDESQIRVLAEGLLGGLSLVVMQVVVSVIAQLAQLFLSGTPQEFALMAPAPEELIFTMIIFGTLRAAMPGLPWFVPAIPSSMIFALFHFWAYGVQMISFMILLVGGFVHAYLYERTDDIGTSMVSHLVVNGAPLMFVMAALFFSYWWVGAIAIAVYAIWFFVLRRK